jgi:hypothetical protein
MHRAQAPSCHFDSTVVQITDAFDYSVILCVTLLPPVGRLYKSDFEVSRGSINQVRLVGTGPTVGQNQVI